jgi:hypothetical protein
MHQPRQRGPTATLQLQHIPVRDRHIHERGRAGAAVGVQRQPGCARFDY